VLVPPARVIVPNSLRTGALPRGGLRGAGGPSINGRGEQGFMQS